MLVATGGDVLCRDDLEELVARAELLKMPVALAPSVTPLLSERRIALLRRLGVTIASISLDGATPAVHDGVRGVPATSRRRWRRSACCAASASRCR